MSKNLNPKTLPAVAEHSTSGSERRIPDWPTDSSTPAFKLAVSQHGDIDIVRGVPTDLAHVKVPRVSPTCKRLGIQYAKALIGWDDVGTKSYPIHAGIVILATDLPRLEAALKSKESKRQKKIERLSVLAALFTLNRRAKRCRDLAQTYYRHGMHGLAGKMKRQKDEIYDLKGQVIHHLMEAGILIGGQFHRFEFGNWAEILGGEGYRFHRPCPPQVLANDSQQIESIESRPKEAKEPSLEIAFEVIEKFLQDKPRTSVYEWPVPRWCPHRWNDDIEEEWDNDEEYECR